MVPTKVRFEVLSRCTPLPGVREPLDRVIVDKLDQGVRIALIDARGQGCSAAESVDRAGGTVRRALRSGAADTFVQVHGALEGRSGVSLGILRIQRRPRRLEFFGVGRIYGAFAGLVDQTLVSEPGALGLGLRKVPSPVELTYSAGDLIALAADGPVDAWDLAALWRHREADLGTLVNLAAGPHGRLPDDASIVLVRLA